MKKIEAFENSKVTLTDSYYVNATDKVVKNILTLDADRLLAGFRENAVLAWNSDPSKEMITATEEVKINKGKNRYGGWENTLIAGHTLGHFLTALAQAYVNPVVNVDDKTACKKTCDYIVSELKKCQDLTTGTKYDGLIFGGTLPEPAFRMNIDLQFKMVEERKSDIFKESWVPYYNLHKILQGLLDVYVFTGNKEALEISEKLGFWINRRVSAWDDKTRQNVLSIEYGGINDVLYQLYALSSNENKEAFLNAAHQFDEETLFTKVRKNTPDAMNNTHANTTIPKFMGALQRYNVTGDEIYLDYTKAFWTMVTQKHTYITGGNSENEHFGLDNVLAAERTHVNNETCNTYNMLKLSRNLFEITGDKKYADYYENTYLNAIMASQNPETGCTMYFQPMATGYQKCYTTVDKSFWCCTGTGWENFTKLQDSIYYRSESSVIINNFVPSVLDTGSAKIKVECNFLSSDKVNVLIDGNAASDLVIRIPEWTDSNAVKASCNYKNENGFMKFSKDDVNAEKKIEITFPMTMKAFGLQDDENTVAFKYGPFVLSARLGTANQETGSHGMWVTVPAKKAVENDEIKISGDLSIKDFIASPEKHFEKTMELGMPVFTLKDCDRILEFIPHYLQCKESYGIYWKFEK